MAAEVVKQYLLPMFEADSKNFIRDKRAQERKNLGLTRKESIQVEPLVQHLKPIEGKGLLSNRGGYRISEGCLDRISLQRIEAEC